MGRKTRANKSKKSVVSLRTYYSVMQLRTESWKKLKDNAGRLAEVVAQGHDYEALKQQLTEGLDLLEVWTPARR